MACAGQTVPGEGRPFRLTIVAAVDHQQAAVCPASSLAAGVAGGAGRMRASRTSITKVHLWPLLVEAGRSALGDMARITT